MIGNVGNVGNFDCLGRRRGRGGEPVGEWAVWLIGGRGGKRSGVLRGCRLRGMSGVGCGDSRSAERSGVLRGCPNGAGALRRGAAVALAAFVAASAALLSGCGGLLDLAQPPAQGGAASQPAVNSGIYNSDYSLDEGAVSGGSVRIYATVPDTLNPLLTDNAYAKEMASLVYEGLAKMGPSLKAEFGLAASWQASEDGLVWAIGLRRGIYWHDGAEFTSSDVVETISRLKDYGGESPYAQMASNINAWEADGRYAVALTLAKPNAFTPETLIFPIVPAHISIDTLSGADDSATLSRFLVGTGPYRFGACEPGSSLTLVANEARRAYWRAGGWQGDGGGQDGDERGGGDQDGAEQEGAGQGGNEQDGADRDSAERGDAGQGEADQDGGVFPPYIDSVTFVLRPPSEQALTLYREKAVDAFFSRTMDYSKYKDSIEMQVKLYSEREFTFIAFNCEKSLASPSARNAIARLIDKDALIDSALGGKGIAAAFPVQPESWLYEPGVPAIALDPQAARSMLEGDGFRLDNGIYYKPGPDGSRKLELTLLANGENAAHALIADSIAETLLQYGISVVVQKEDYGAMAQIMVAGEFDMALASYRVGAIPDMTELYSESWHRGDRANNVARYADGDVDRIAGELYIDMDALGRQAAFADLAAILNRDMPYIGLYFQASSLVLENNIRGSIFPCSWEPFCDIGKWYIADYR
jgi:peptide/nickel transport system substrate-binding protein